MFGAHRKHQVFTELDMRTADATAYKANFLKWYRQMKATGDVPFMFYSGIVVGHGILYRTVRRARSLDDPLLLYAMLLVMMGLYKLAGKFNLMRQCFLVLLKFITSPIAVAHALLGA
eukprot:469022-Prymnesium_polylepis.1